MTSHQGGYILDVSNILDVHDEIIAGMQLYVLCHMHPQLTIIAMKFAYPFISKMCTLYHV